MTFWEYFFNNNLYLNYFAELIAVMAGLIYLYKLDPTPKRNALFVIYLISVLICEIIGLYPLIAYLNDYKVFGFIKDTLFFRNFWLYNSFTVLQAYLLFNFWKMQVESGKLRRVIEIYCWVYFPLSIIAVLTYDHFFHAYSQTIYIGNAFGLLICIGAYFLSILRSEDLVNIVRTFPFYAASLLLIWNLTLTPLFIFSEFINVENEAFIKIYYGILRYSNLILYLGYAVAFYIDYRSRKKLWMDMDG